MEEDSASAIRYLIDAFVDIPGGLLPALHAVQDSHGWIPNENFSDIAEAFNIGVAEVAGVVSFYHDFRTTPPQGPVVKMCRGEACQARGAVAMIDEVRAALDGAAIVEDVFCLGNCALGPCALYDGEVLAHVTPESVAGRVRRDNGNPVPDVAHTRSRVPVVAYVPADTAACSVGADAVAAAFAAAGCDVVRTGSRGMFWLEPMIEIDASSGRVGFGPVTADDVASLVEAIVAGEPHPKSLGPVDELPWMQVQNRWTFARVGVIDPLSPADYEAHGGLAGWRAALAMDPAEVVAAVTASGLRGRGGAAFPAGVKWQTVADAPITGPGAAQKYVCANADEGDSGTFADRMLMEGDPFSLIEGMAIAGHAVGATMGYIYIRSEYPAAVATMRSAIDIARAEGWLGPNCMGTEVAFDVEIRVGAGAYICGEETSMLESLEGKRGEVRAKPPLPAHVGLFGKPTVINNVLTLGSVPGILATPDGAARYAALGVGRSTGTQVFQLAGNIARGGAIEVPFGITLRQLVEDFGGGTASGRPIGAVQVGGPLGSYLPADQLDLPMDYEAFAAAGALVGHGGIVVFDDTVNMAAQARFAMEFCAIESCGKCTPCRIGSTRGVELLDRRRLADVEELCETMTDGSLCALGGLTPLPVRSALEYWPTHFAANHEGGAS